MKKTTQKNLSKVAEKNGLPEEEIYKEMQAAINKAMLSQKPEAIKFWQEIKEKGIESTPENIIDFILKKELS